MQFYKRKEEKEKVPPRIDRPHVEDKTWKVAGTWESDHIGERSHGSVADGDAQGR